MNVEKRRTYIRVTFQLAADMRHHSYFKSRIISWKV